MQNFGKMYLFIPGVFTTNQSNPSSKEWPDTDSGLSSTASPNSQSSEDIAVSNNVL